MKTLVGYDGSESAQRALSLAAELARRSGDVEVGVVHVASSSAAVAAHFEGDQEELLTEARALIGQHGRSAVTLRRRGIPARELLATAGEINADLVVIGTRGLGAFYSAILGSVSSEVAAKAGCPVVVVPPRGRGCGDPVIAAGDGTETSGEVIGVARGLGRLFAVPVLIAHAFVARPIPGVSAVPHGREVLARSERKNAERLLARTVCEHGVAGEENRLVEGVSEAQALVSMADQQRAAALVVGSRGHGPMKAAVLGSVSSAVARRASCPVVIVPPGAGTTLAG
jgi:nucleotide-binding universal stress UspA family protein